MKSTQFVHAVPAFFFFAFGTAAAFTTTHKHSVATIITTAPVSSRVGTTRLYFEQEESEWYSPPPAPVRPAATSIEQEAAIKLPRGVTPKTRTIEAHIDLDEFLAEDDRLCVVKFHAAW